MHLCATLPNGKLSGIVRKREKDELERAMYLRRSKHALHRQQARSSKWSYAERLMCAYDTFGSVYAYESVCMRWMRVHMSCEKRAATYTQHLAYGTIALIPLYGAWSPEWDTIWNAMNVRVCKHTYQAIAMMPTRKVSQSLRKIRRMRFTISIHKRE